ncbi:hypothetical protein Plhal703r1_c72g0171781 [Plasmopara halstedii]
MSVNMKHPYRGRSRYMSRRVSFTSSKRVSLDYQSRMICYAYNHLEPSALMTFARNFFVHSRSRYKTISVDKLRRRPNSPDNSLAVSSSRTRKIIYATGLLTLLRDWADWTKATHMMIIVFEIVTYSYLGSYKCYMWGIVTLGLGLQCEIAYKRLDEVTSLFKFPLRIWLNRGQKEKSSLGDAKAHPPSSRPSSILYPKRTLAKPDYCLAKLDGNVATISLCVRPYDLKRLEIPLNLNLEAIL